MVDIRMNEAPLPLSGAEDPLDFLQSLPLDITTKDPLPFEEISENITDESPLGGSGRVLKNKAGQLTLNKTITEMTHEKTIEMLQNRSAKVYGPQAPKLVQLDSVIDLIHLRDTFVIAGTGVGKSRIAEMYWDLFPKYRKPIVLVLNPLDSLGDNQVEEKKSLGISAINLTKMNLNEKVEKDILKGDYSFIYLSPEVLLNNAIFSRIFYNETFQNRVLLVVVDEAHMIYVWGLVASGKSKKLFSHGRHQDRAVFCPSYGDIAARLLGINAPLLLLSATCRPQAIKASKVIHEARRIEGGHGDANSTFARRFHACSGDVSKEETTKQFAAGEFPVISCTMALGLGQNWKRVRSVVHVGRGDPASICQMIGRCGRGGTNGLAILFVEANRRSGKNCVEEFVTPAKQTDDERMDALAITPVCLQICFAIDNM
ncbi:hypothetical protein PTTG_09886 [Puccinia triticina 1-1 BBBD Race 1]|uniref:DNA 3'-5' helicase n=1 Tax=Puccinia triticina (isolate 1-1 / race 1 (BBBD)) TaxID=630390 RepID=A0A180GHF1_PUCT1|nr:hypothetical protein PTTG_09886 [Puccinia triticina 1-1 BBBD Race 1]